MFTGASFTAVIETTVVCTSLSASPSKTYHDNARVGLSPELVGLSLVEENAMASSNAGQSRWSLLRRTDRAARAIRIDDVPLAATPSTQQVAVIGVHVAPHRNKSAVDVGQGRRRGEHDRHRVFRIGRGGGDRRMRGIVHGDDI